MNPSVIQGWWPRSRGVGHRCGRASNRAPLRPQQVAGYPSDLTDDEWRLVEPPIPPGKTGGGKRTVIMREVVERGPHVHPLDRLSVARDPERPAAEKLGSTTTSICGPYDGTLERIHHALYEQCRAKQAQREASPTAAIIDNQSVKSAEKGGARIDPHGFDAGKKIKGKKRQLHSCRHIRACCSTPSFIRLTFKIAMEAFFLSWRPCSGCFPF